MSERNIRESLRVAERALSESRQRTVLNREAEGVAGKLIAVDQELVSRSRQSLAESYMHLRPDPGTAVRNLEVAHLRQADRHIAAAHARLDRQRRLIADLRRDQHPVRLAESLLDTMLASLRAMESHRLVIRQRLGLPAPEDKRDGDR